MDLRDKKYFYFTQNSLNTFKNCPFKFKKKYIDNIKWQEEESNEITENIEFGLDFHKLAQRYFSNIPVFEESFKENEKLFLAYRNLVDYFPINDKFKYYPEYSIRYSKDDIRLEANIDLIIVGDDFIEIWDWKTNAKMDEKKYLDSLQTKVYMYVLAKSLRDIFGKDFSDIKMTYFSPENKCEITSVTYSEEKLKKDEKYIKNLVEKIYNYKWDEFNKEEVKKHCKYCEFNLFCSSVKNEAKYEFGSFNWDDIEEVF